METRIVVRCSLPGLEQVEVVYNMMASRAQINAFMNGATPESALPVAEIRNWPAGMGEPFTDTGPWAFGYWAVNQGWAAARQGFLASPNS